MDKKEAELADFWINKDHIKYGINKNPLSLNAKNVNLQYHLSKMKVNLKQQQISKISQSKPKVKKHSDIDKKNLVHLI